MCDQDIIGLTYIDVDGSWDTYEVPISMLSSFSEKVGSAVFRGVDLLEWRAKCNPQDSTEQFYALNACFESLLELIVAHNADWQSFMRSHMGKPTVRSYVIHSVHQGNFCQQ